LIAEIVQQIESGVPRKVIQEQYGVSHESLATWIQRYSSSGYQPPVRKVYTTSQKRSIVRAVEGGMSIKAAVIAFDISHRGLISHWRRIFKEENMDISIPKPTKMRKKTKDNSTAEIEALRQALSDANLKIKALDTLIDVAQENLKIDIRKKPGAKQSPK
jgi:transposase